MSDIELGAVQERFADIVWENEPIGSGELVKLAAERLNWKKPTTYTVLRKLCEKDCSAMTAELSHPWCRGMNFTRRKADRL